MSGQKTGAKKQPRYIELADDLREEVLNGAYSDPGEFPTESVLCKKYGVSRFTVREALRKLTMEGLIARKRGSGTVVQPAIARGGALHQPLSNISEILQYARDTTISFVPMPAQDIPAKITEQLGISPKRKWFVFHGERMKAGRRRPIAVTIAWINPDLADVVAQIDPEAATLFSQLEEKGNLSVGRITQDIQAISASKSFARRLGIEKGDPILRILRCYFDRDDRMFEISASYHPGERFAYSMHIEAD
ncbi:GntR family transcriptional regulator [Alterisphingorhabdus coralli]|uniref:GntR family transcriptional regulator n=1 Tax=Alterisphingorhabdus coralli TaxID=3071408 RepID=A0AA97I238_9SPHN|nr:GntR family transcriptional regulator [Parasphingorhabdus sp. SCSIO 66989]WOE75380.1 GntR family transcriptional regulator [Parasphingorhabdus sp. SCSIO 66989]